ncbi:MAG: hypothetical protein ABI675_28550 [Chitinophagaceae bacterium]
MNKDLIKEIPADEPIVIADECGDSLWDAVLQQDVKACDVINTSKGASALLNGIEKIQVSEETKG